MEENPNSASNILSSILGSGGVGSVASGAGDVICAIKGNCPPKNLTVVNQQPPNNNNNMLLLIGGGIFLVIIMVVLLKK